MLIRKETFNSVETVKTLLKSLPDFGKKLELFPPEMLPLEHLCEQPVLTSTQSWQNETKNFN